MSVDPGPYEQEKKKTDYKIQKQTQACIKSDSVEKVPFKQWRKNLTNAIGINDCCKTVLDLFSIP